LDRLLGAEDLLDASAQRLGAIDDEEIFTIGRQALIAQMGQQTLDGGGILSRARLDPQDVLLAFCIHAHRAENVMVPKALPVDIDRQNLDAVPTPLLQLLQLLGAGLDGVATDRTA